ncbi:MAG: hypothetical protein IKM33_01835 [Clostridia bacterium]|nr:hypothetical protein [Clostridia bacterium]
MELVLTDGKVLNELAHTDKSLWGKVKSWISNIISKIRKHYGELNQASKTARVLKETMDSLDEIERLFTEGAKEAGERAKAAETGEVVQGANDVVYDIAMLEDGKMYVYASRNVISGTGVDKWRAQITKFFKTLLEHKKSLDIPTQEGGVLTITMDQTEYKARDNYKSVAGNRIQLSEDEFLVKLHAEAHIDELAEISREGKQGVVEDSKNHEFAKDGFTYRTAYFRDFDGKYYKVEFSVGHNSGKAVVYNIGKIKEDALPSAKIIAVVGSKGPWSASSVDSIPQDSYSVNTSTENSSENSSDTAYLSAVERGDMETAQRMVDEAAKKAGYVNLFYHGAKKGGGFTVFRDWSYFTENKAYAERYTDREKPSSLYRTYVKLEKAFDTRKAKDRRIFVQIRDEYGLGEIQDTGLPDWTDGYDISDYIDENDLDYDGIILDEGGDLVNGEPVSRGLSYVVRKSAQIKSADPVTYDDGGDVIPLSERFKEDNSDIRYSMDETPENADVSGNEAERLFTEGVREAGERARTAGTSEAVKRADRVYSFGEETGQKEMNESSVEIALWESFDHNDAGDDNLISLGGIPETIRKIIDVSGELYVYRDHIYEKMVSREQAIQDGRPVTRGRKNVDFHNLGFETVKEALLSIKDPVVAIADKTKEGNPAIWMILPQKGPNDAPLYAVISLYANRHINGVFKRRPHVVLTVAPRAYTEDGGRIGYDQIIRDAVDEGRVLIYNKKMRDTLSVIAHHARMGNITEASLKDNIAQFRKKVNSFKEKNKIFYSVEDRGENADVRENERLKAENKKLEERVQRMRYRQFRKALESGEMEAKAHKQELSDGATTVLESIGIGDGRNHAELTRRMSELYAKMAGEKKISYGEAFEESSKIAEWLLGIQPDIRYSMDEAMAKKNGTVNENH